MQNKPIVCIETCAFINQHDFHEAVSGKLSLYPLSSKLNKTTHSMACRQCLHFPQADADKLTSWLVHHIVTLKLLFPTWVNVIMDISKMVQNHFILCSKSYLLHSFTALNQSECSMSVQNQLCNNRVVQCLNY